MPYLHGWRLLVPSIPDSLCPVMTAECVCQDMIFLYTVYKYIYICTKTCHNMCGLRQTCVFGSGCLQMLQTVTWHQRLVLKDVDVGWKDMVEPQRVTCSSSPHIISPASSICFCPGYVLFPLAIHAMDIIVSGVGIMMTEAPKGKSSKLLSWCRSFCF